MAYDSEIRGALATSPNILSEAQIERVLDHNGPAYILFLKIVDLMLDPDPNPEAAQTRILAQWKTIEAALSPDAQPEL